MTNKQVGYIRLMPGKGFSKGNQLSVLVKSGVLKNNITTEDPNSSRMVHPKLNSLILSLPEESTIAISDLPVIGGSMRDLTSLLLAMSDRGISLSVINAPGLVMDTATLNVMYDYHRMISGINVKDGLASAKARGNVGGRKSALTESQVRWAQDQMRGRELSISEIAKELEITTVTLYRYVAPDGSLRSAGKRVINT